MQSMSAAELHEKEASIDDLSTNKQSQTMIQTHIDRAQPIQRRERKTNKWMNETNEMNNKPFKRAVNK